MRVLNYHGVVERATEGTHLAQLFTDVRDFEEQVVLLRRTARPVSLAELEHGLRAGDGPEGNLEGTVHVSFDDGYRNNLVAAEILDRHRVPWSLFVVVDAVLDGYQPWFLRLADAIRATPHVRLRDGSQIELGNTRQKRLFARRAKTEVMTSPDGDQDGAVDEIVQSLGMRVPDETAWPLLSAVELRDLHGTGVEIGNHSARHRNLVRCSDQDLHDEVVQSRDRLERMLGHEVRAFAYPDGRHDHRLRRVAGASHALALATWTVRASTRPSAVRRYEPLDASDLGAILASPEPWYGRRWAEWNVPWRTRELALRALAEPAPADDARGLMRIVTVTWRFPDPSEPFAVDQVVELARRGHDVVVVADEVRLRDHPDVRRRLGDIEVRAARRQPRIRGDRPRWFDRRADVVDFLHLHMALDHVDTLRRLPAATLVTCRGSDIRVAPGVSAAIRDATARLLATVDGIRCISADLARRCVELGAPGERVHVLSHGLDVARFPPRPAVPQGPAPRPGPSRLVSVGRIHWVKGYEYALQAVRMLRDAGRPVRYTIVGIDDGAERSVRLAIDDLDLGDVVELVGSLRPIEVGAVLAESDVFVLSSVSEGMSQAAMEAMAVGLPVVVTDVGGMRELVEDGKHGRVVPSRDPGALADAIESVLASGRAAEMGRLGSAHVRAHFDGAVQHDALEQLYEDICAAR